jgi:catechol 2,3-dioxygenase
MPTKQLDIEAILQEIDRERDPASAAYPAAPEGLRIGHVHLRVGNIEKAEEFYRGALGLELTRRRGGATFMSSGGYHHHVGANVWHSDGAGLRDGDRTGLAWFSIEAADDAAYDAAVARLKSRNAPVDAAAGGIETADPFGTRVRILKS